MVRRDVADRYTTANLSIRYENGKTIISGEVIKAFLEFYHGRIMPEGFNYLDHVYGVNIPDSGGLSLPTKIQTNGTTFAAMGIKDDFTAVLPNPIQMRVDNALTFKNELEV